MELKQPYSTEIEAVRLAVESVMSIDIFDRKRSHHIVEARMIFTSILKDRKHSYYSIAKYLGRDHSTVMYYYSSIKDLIRVNKNVLKNYTKCQEELLIKEDYLNLNNNKDYLLLEVEVLRSKVKILEQENKELINKNEESIKDFTFDNKNRLTKVFKFIDENTPEGREHVIYRRIKKLFNG